MKWEVPPHTDRGFILISLIHMEDKNIQQYVSFYLPKILSGVYDIDLTNPEPY